jgi:GNAT superfamily N-acetyltransferase
MSALTFRIYDDSLAPDFRRLNLEWIKKHFVVEPHDLEQLDHPREHIINPGGEILFALLAGEIVGVCAIIKTGENEFEIAKMSVASSFQGRGFGGEICRKAIETARRMGARRIWLASNTKLKPALRVYEKLGFKEFSVVDSPYTRVDIHMELLLDP